MPPTPPTSSDHSDPNGEQDQVKDPPLEFPKAPPIPQELQSTGTRSSHSIYSHSTHAPPSTTQQLMRVSVIGTNFAFTVAGATFMGWLLDRWLGTSPIITGSLAGLGLIIALSRFIKEARTLIRPTPKP